MINKSILNIIAEETKLKTETLSETFPLYRRDLLLNENYDKLIFPIFNDISINSVIENILYLNYLKNKYNTKIILVLDKRSEYKHFYRMFNIDASIIECKRLIELDNICKDECITKIIYNRSFNNIVDTKDFLTSVSLSEFKNIENVSVYSEKDDKYYVISSKNNELTEKLIAKIESQKNAFNPKFIILSGKNDDTYIRNVLSLIINNYSAYINIYNNSNIDYIAPFSGCQVYYIGTELYSNKIFDFSKSKTLSKIKNISSIIKKEIK